MELLSVIFEAMSLIFGRDVGILVGIVAFSAEIFTFAREKEANRIRNRQAALENMDAIDDIQFMLLLGHWNRYFLQW
jgi:hypothetical protein